jgi:hypothetical protein
MRGKKKGNMKNKKLRKIGYKGMTEIVPSLYHPDEWFG